MAKPREFDEEKVLLLAVSRFWEYGDEATSLRDLAQAIGLATASMYNAFGDKRAFYRKALDFYVEQNFAGRFEMRPSLEAISGFFKRLLSDRQAVASGRLHAGQFCARSRTT